MPEPTTSAAAMEFRFPKTGIGIILSVLSLVVSIVSVIVQPVLVTTGPSFKIENPVYLFGVALYFAAFIYIFVCIHQLHRVLHTVTQNHYPISPAKAVGFNFIPFFNLYWIFKWPIEIVNFINTVEKEKKLLNWLPGLLMLLSTFFGRGLLAGLGPLAGFAVLGYLSKKVKLAIQKQDAATQNYIANYKPALSYRVAIIVSLLVTILFAGLMIMIAIPFLYRTTKVAKERAAEAQRLRLEQERAMREFEGTVVNPSEEVQ